MYNAIMVSIQVRDVPEQVRDTLAEVARREGIHAAYLLSLLEEDARQARNVMLLRQVRETGGGYVAAAGETEAELDAIRAERISGTPMPGDLVDAALMWTRDRGWPGRGRRASRAGR